MDHKLKKSTINKTNFALATSTVISFQGKTNTSTKTEKKTTQVWT